MLPYIDLLLSVFPCYSILFEFINLISMFDLCQHHIDCLLCNIVRTKYGKRWVPNNFSLHCVIYAVHYSWCLSTCSTVAVIALHHFCNKTKSGTVNCPPHKSSGLLLEQLTCQCYQTMCTSSH